MARLLGVMTRGTGTRKAVRHQMQSSQIYRVKSLNKNLCGFYVRKIRHKDNQTNDKQKKIQKKMALRGIEERIIGGNSSRHTDNILNINGLKDDLTYVKSSQR